MMEKVGGLSETGQDCYMEEIVQQKRSSAREKLGRLETRAQAEMCCCEERSFV